MRDHSKKNKYSMVNCSAFGNNVSIKVDDPNCHLEIDGFRSVSAENHFEIPRIGSLKARNVYTEDKKPVKAPRKLFAGWTPPRKG